MNNIINRRSIRQFKDKDVTQDECYEIIKAAMYAPSAFDQKPWEFVLIKQKEILCEISKLSKHAVMAKGAPVAILVCANMNYVVDEYFYVQDCSAATENMLLQICEMNLGGVWVGIKPNDDLLNYLIRRLSLPGYVKPFSLVVFGHPKGNRSSRDNFDKQRIHYDQW